MNVTPLASDFRNSMLFFSEIIVGEIIVKSPDGEPLGGARVEEEEVLLACDLQVDVLVLVVVHLYLI